jgi:xylono-1,5-lactonase
LFVDIHGQQVHAYGLRGGTRTTWAAPQKVGWLIRAGQAWVAGLQEGMARVVLGDAGQMEIQAWISRPFGARASMRLNDAKADRQGRIWAGSLDNDAEGEPHGALYCLGTDGQLRTVDTGYCVANGPAISPDGQLLLHTDSVKKTIYAFDLDETAGTLANKRVWAVLGDADGYPDGMNFDAEGCLWLAHWGAGCVSRWAPDGRMLAKVALPASQVTNVTFGGANLDRLFVTTARVGLSDARLAAEPLAGGLFEIEGHGARGVAPCSFKG